MSRNHGYLAGLVLLAAGLLCALAGCGRSGSSDECFVVLKGAGDAVADEVPGTGGEKRLVYQTKAFYPALPEIGQIREQIESHGWTPLADDPLTTSSEKMYFMNWRTYDDHSGKELERVHQWLGAWENKRHDMVEYTLTYRYPRQATPNTHDVEVIANYYPAAVLKEKLKGRSLTPAQPKTPSGPETKY